MSGSQSRFLDTRGNATLGIGLCARCATKRPLHELMSDPNASGLKVCRDPSEGCIDRYDPYRLSNRVPDPITLPFTRPDQRFDSVPDVMDWLRDDTPPSHRLVTEQGVYRITEQGFPRVIERGEDV